VGFKNIFKRRYSKKKIGSTCYAYNGPNKCQIVISEKADIPKPTEESDDTYGPQPVIVPPCIAAAATRIVRRLRHSSTGRSSLQARRVTAASNAITPARLSCQILFLVLLRLEQRRCGGGSMLFCAASRRRTCLRRPGSVVGRATMAPRRRERREKRLPCRSHSIPSLLHGGYIFSDESMVIRGIEYLSFRCSRVGWWTGSGCVPRVATAAMAASAKGAPGPTT
jgi:hypothetical protein